MEAIAKRTKTSIDAKTVTTTNDVTLKKCDLIIHGGRVIDPFNGIDAQLDVVVSNGKIVEVSPQASTRWTATTEFDASNKIVSPGLIDLHVHVYDAFTPISVEADKDCLARGVTTVVDQGSAGASTFAGLKKYIMKPSKTRVLAFLNIALEGLAWSGMAGGAPGGELDNMNQIVVQPAVDCIEANRDVICGVKIRLTACIANDGKNEKEAFARAQKVAEICKVPLMTHHSMSSVPLVDCPGALRKGDLYTHTYHGWDTTITDQKGLILNEACLTARKNGVLFDVGHGGGAFNWTVAEAACQKQGFFPDVISTDLHKVNVNGPAYDLPTVMTKFLHLGMTLPDIIKSVTSTSAAAISRSDTIGSLSVGVGADITVLSIDDVDVELEDVHRQTRNIKKRIRPVAVWRDGESFAITSPTPFPNPLSGNPKDFCLSTLKVRDFNWKEILKRNNMECC
eukprot:m.13798 g.13798  ORF g.13798 m.13798 type:complete len:453 (-) comp9866_c0_seq1:84-1442(-)